MTSWERSFNRQLMAQHIFTDTPRPMPLPEPSHSQEDDRMDWYLMFMGICCLIAALLVVIGWRL